LHDRASFEVAVVLKRGSHQEDLIKVDPEEKGMPL
jgi:hypothetical protein